MTARQRQVECTPCQGLGSIELTGSRCAVCGGSGWVSEVERCVVCGDQATEDYGTRPVCDRTSCARELARRDRDDSRETWLEAQRDLRGGSK